MRAYTLIFAFGLVACAPSACLQPSAVVQAAIVETNPPRPSEPSFTLSLHVQTADYIRFAASPETTYVFRTPAKNPNDTFLMAIGANGLEDRTALVESAGAPGQASLVYYAKVEDTEIVVAADSRHRVPMFTILRRTGDSWTRIHHSNGSFGSLIRAPSGQLVIAPYFSSRFIDMQGKPVLGAPERTTRSVANGGDGRVIVVATGENDEPPGGLEARDVRNPKVLVWDRAGTHVEELPVRASCKADPERALAAGPRTYVVGNRRCAEKDEAQMYVATFDGNGWSEVGPDDALPRANLVMGGVDGALYALVPNGAKGANVDKELWRRSPKGAWTHIPLPDSSGCYGHDIAADRRGLWLIQACKNGDETRYRLYRIAPVPANGGQVL